MAIRFQCSSCSQPIEIDDVWSSKLVACPYCQNTVTAPANSTLADLSATPTATPISDYQTGQDYAGNFSNGMPAPRRRSRLGLVAIILAGVTIALVIAAIAVCTPHVEQLGEFNDKTNEFIKQGMDQFTASQHALAEIFPTSPGSTPPMWMVLAGLILIGAGLTWLTAITCAFIALRNPTTRKQAYIALGMCALPLVLVRFSG